MNNHRKKLLLAVLAASAVSVTAGAVDQGVGPSQNTKDSIVTSAGSTTSQSSMISLTKPAPAPVEAAGNAAEVSAPAEESASAPVMSEAEIASVVGEAGRALRGQ
jgi:hypothetical protein